MIQVRERSGRPARQRSAIMFGVQQAFGGGNNQEEPVSFGVALQTSIVPENASGDGTPTFTRNLASYTRDFEDRHVLVPANAARCMGCRVVQNLLTIATEDFRVWTASTNISATAADTLTATAGTSFKAVRHIPTVGAAFPVGVGIYAVDAKAGTHDVIQLLYDGDGVPHANFNLTTLATGGNGDQWTEQLPDGWVRVFHKYTHATSTGVYVGVVTNTASIRAESTAVTGTVFIRKAMLESKVGVTNQNPSEYVSVGVLSAPYHGLGVDGIKAFDTLNGNTVTNNVVTEATGALIRSGVAGVAATAPVDSGGPHGYLAESAATQIIAATADIRDMTTASWTAGATLTRARTSVGADGAANSATRLTGGAVDATNTITYLVTAAASSRTYSALVKRVTGTGPVLIMQGATTTDISSLINSTTYTLVSLNASVLNATIGFRVDTNLDAIDVDFNQFEAGAIATSRIATGGATRPADVDSGVSAGNISANGYFSVTGEITPSTALGSATVFHWSTYVDVDNYTAILSDGTNLIARKRIGGTSNDATIAWTRTVGTALKFAAGFGPTGIDIAAAGTLGTRDATGTASQVGTTFEVGTDGNGANQDNCDHRNLRIYPVALPSATLSQKTQP